MNPVFAHAIAERLCLTAARLGFPVVLKQHLETRKDGNEEKVVTVWSASADGGPAWLGAAVAGQQAALLAYLKGPEIILWRLGSVTVARLPRRDGAADSRAPFMTDGWRLVDEPWRSMDSLPPHWNLAIKIQTKELKL